MTLQIRLAAMMGCIVLAVLALQYVLLERESRDLARRLAQLSSEVNRSTLRFAERAHAAGEDASELESLLDEFGAEVRGGGRGQLQVFAWADTGRGFQEVPAESLRVHATIRRLGSFAQTRMLADSMQRQGHGIQKVFVQWRSGEMPADSVGMGDLARAIERHTFEEAVVVIRDSTHRDPGVDRDFVVNLPLTGPGLDGQYAVRLRYPLGELEEELAHSRRRGLYWLSALLGVGVLGTVLVARQFTRPIQGLKDSFARVKGGDLEVRASADRHDEIGELTASFNEMVARLRESKAMETRLADAEHLAALGRLAAGVAHEVRNPLNGILLTLQHLRDRRGSTHGASAGEDEVYYAMVTGEIARLDRIVTAFLDLSKAGEVVRERLDLAENLGAALALYRPVFEEKGILLEVAIEPNLPLLGDRTRLPMIWNNLLSNALEAARHRVTVRATALTDHVVVEVTDDGPGVPPDARARIWEPFYTDKPNGTGLGLALARSVVDRHAGTIEVLDGVDGGARLRVVFPRDAKTTPSNAEGA